MDSPLFLVRGPQMALDPPLLLNPVAREELLRTNTNTLSAQRLHKVAKFADDPNLVVVRYIILCYKFTKNRLSTELRPDPLGGL